MCKSSAVWIIILLSRSSKTSVAVLDTKYSFNILYFTKSQKWYTEWFKINSTIFKSHISHKWENNIDLFEDIYKVWYLGRMWWKWHQNCTDVGKLNGSPFLTNGRHFTCTQSIWSLVGNIVLYRVGNIVLYRGIIMHTAQSINQSVNAWCSVVW